jgi:hypothetical protein
LEQEINPKKKTKNREIRYFAFKAIKPACEGALSQLSDQFLPVGAGYNHVARNGALATDSLLFGELIFFDEFLFNWSNWT